MCKPSRSRLHLAELDCVTLVKLELIDEVLHPSLELKPFFMLVKLF